MLDILSRVLLGPPILATFFVAFITVIAALGVVQLKFDDGLIRTFESRTDDFNKFQKEQALFGRRAPEIVVHIKSEDLSLSETFNAVREFVLRLSLFSGVEAVESVFSLRHVIGSGGSTAPVFDAVLDSDESVSDALDNAYEHPLNLGRFISKDKKNILAAVALSSNDEVPLEDVLNEINNSANSSFQDIEVETKVTGLAVLRLRVIQNIVRDQAVINLFGAVVGVLLCFLAFRNIPLTLIAGIPAVMSLLWVLGLFGLLGIPITTVTNTLPVLIMVLAFADSMHLTQEIRRQLASGIKLRLAIGNALKITGPACVMASVTTAIAFSALYLSQSAQIRELALVGSLAVLVSLMGVVFINPLAAWWLLRSKAGHSETGSGTQALFFSDHVWLALVKFAVYRSGSIAIFGFGVMAVSALIYSGIESRYSFQENVSNTSTEWLDYQQVENTFVPLSTFGVVVPTQTDRAGVTPESLQYLGDVHERLALTYGERNVVSLWTVANWINPADPASTASIMERLFEEQNRPVPFLSKDGTAAKIEILTQDHGSEFVRAHAAKIDDLAAGPTSVAASPPWTTGLLVMSAHVSDTMIGDLHLSFLAAVFVSGVLIAVWTRNVVVGLAATVVNFLPIILVGGWLVLSGNNLQFTSALALTIAFGIAVDDTVHALNKLRPQLLAREPVNKSDIEQAFVSIVPVLFATTVILSAGIATTFVSSMPMIVYFGQLAIVVFILALVADLLVLPAILTRVPLGRSQ